jgi:hypothetical protein
MSYRNPFKSEKEEFITFLEDITVGEWFDTIIPTKYQKKLTIKKAISLALELFTEVEIKNLINSSDEEDIVFKRIKTELYFKFHHLNDCKYNLKYFSCSEASLKGDLKFLKLMFIAGFRNDDVDVIDNAAKRNDLDMLNFALESKFPMGKFAAINSAANGHLVFLKKVIENNGSIDQDAALYATIGGHVECLKLLVENNCVIDFNVYLAAARFGHLNCLEYLFFNHSTVFDYNIPITAANNGNWNVFQFCYNIFPNKEEFCKVKYNIQKMKFKMNLNDMKYNHLYTKLEII